MTGETPRQMRLADIDRGLAEVARLMDLATDEPTQEQVRLASRDLNEALMWLRPENIESGHLLIVDVILMLVDSRLKLVNDGLGISDQKATLVRPSAD